MDSTLRNELYMERVFCCFSQGGRYFLDWTLQLLYIFSTPQICSAYTQTVCILHIAKSHSTPTICDGHHMSLNAALEFLSVAYPHSYQFHTVLALRGHLRMCIVVVMIFLCGFYLKATIRHSMLCLFEDG